MIITRTLNRPITLVTGKRMAASPRAFAARLCGTRRTAAPMIPVARILRRANDTHTHQTLLAMQFAVRLLNHFTQFNRETTKTLVPREEKQTPQAQTLLRVLDRQRSLETRVIEHRAAQTPQMEFMPQLITPERVKRQIAFPRLLMTFAKPPVAVSATKSTTSPHELRTEITGRINREIESAHSTAQPPLILPVQELSRVTDHVIKQLNRRVLSYRERTGRM